MANKKQKTEKKEKINAGCLKIFEFLRLLYEDKAYYEDVIKIFKDELNEQTANNIQVVLNKHINTFKVFGMKVLKQKNKYQLLSSIYSMPFTPEDIKSISILISSTKNFPDEELSQELSSFLENIQLRMSSPDKTLLDTITSEGKYNFSFKYLEMKEQINQCKELCKSEQLVDIIYYKNSKEIKTKCTPIELLYDSKNVYFKMYDINAKINIEVPLYNILSIRKHPQKSQKLQNPQTVVYKLKNRLARTYKPKIGENVDQNPDGTIIITIKTESPEKLFTRLMRYGCECEIISPKKLRYEFIEFINKTISNYDAE